MARTSASQRARANPRPRKSLGQHFLRDTGVTRDIAAAVGGSPGSPVVEIGPGTGELTARLLERGFEVTGIEIDDQLVGLLRRRFAGARLRVINADAREVALDGFGNEVGAYHLAGNLPYFAANPIIRRFLEAEVQPRTMVVMVQREVARELAAPEGDFSLLTVATSVYAESELLFIVPPEAFDPPPKVHSAVVRLTVRAAPLVPEESREGFFDLVGRTFRNPRKQLHNALAGATHLTVDASRSVAAEAGVDSTRRPETLSIAEWLALQALIEEIPVDGAV